MILLYVNVSASTNISYRTHTSTNINVNMKLVPQLEDTWLVQNGLVMLWRITIIMHLESSEFHAMQ